MADSADLTAFPSPDLEDGRYTLADTTLPQPGANGATALGIHSIAVGTSFPSSGLALAPRATGGETVTWIAAWQNSHAIVGTLDGSLQIAVVVVGAGIAGLSAARAILDGDTRGLKVA